MPSRRTNSSNGRAQRGLASTTGASKLRGGSGKCTRPGSPARSSASFSRLPSRSLVHPVTQAKCWVADSWGTCVTSQSRKANSARMAGSPCASASAARPARTSSACSCCVSMRSGIAAAASSGAAGRWRGRAIGRALIAARCGSSVSSSARGPSSSRKRPDSACTVWWMTSAASASGPAFSGKAYRQASSSGPQPVSSDRSGSSARGSLSRAASSARAACSPSSAWSCSINGSASRAHACSRTRSDCTRSTDRSAAASASTRMGGQ